ncbi:MAG: hypothetical protein JO359_09085, partial [Candidatus Eremiobacteraeota bacterium]|nr:hypothetical protein [Candidatus Eremiobacteraeota bacterium]
ADTDVPIETTFDAYESWLAPPEHGGGIAHLRVRGDRIFTGRLVVLDGTNRVVPRFGRIIVRVPGKAAPVVSDIGEDGEFFFDQLPAGDYPAIVRYKGGECRFTFAANGGTEKHADLGEVLCAVS